jgi:hypothetical protein
MSKSTFHAAAAVLAVLSFAGTNVLAADPAGQNARDLKSNTCKDMMRLSGVDRDVAMALAHGYVLGKKGTTKFEIDKLTQVSEKFFDHCLDNPKDNALAAFEKIAAQ